MGTSVSFNPTNIDFGVVSPKATAGQWVRSAALLAPANVTASIINDDSGGSFKVTAVKSLLPVKQAVDPGELGPGPHRRGKPIWTIVYQPVGQTDGITPLGISSGQVAQVEVQFAAPSQSTDGPRKATLQIIGDGWNPISIPLTALTGQISINIPPISLVQGETIKVPFQVTSLGGPATAVGLSTANPSSLPPGVSVSLSITSLQVSTGNPGSGILTVSAAILAVAGSYPMFIYSSAFNGATNSFGFSVTIGNLTLRMSPIAAKYLALKGPNGVLGSPTAAEAFCYDYIGQFQSYVNGAIFWSGVEGTAAFAVWGAILNQWTDVGFGNREDLYVVPLGSGLGYPITDVQILPPVVPNLSVGQTCHFEHGAIYWSLKTGAHTVGGPIFDAYVALRETAGVLGFPIANARGDTTFTYVDFENGGLVDVGNGAKKVLVQEGLNAFPAQFVLDQLGPLISQAVNNYNVKAAKRNDYTVGLQGGPSFQTPTITDYSQVQDPQGGSQLVTQNRLYRIQQDFFVSLPIFSDATIRLTGDLCFSLGDGGILAKLLNAAALIDTHGNPFATDSDVQKAHDTIIAIANAGATVVPPPVTSPLLSVKVLTSGKGVGLPNDLGDLGGVGALAVLVNF